MSKYGLLVFVTMGVIILILGINYKPSTSTSTVTDVSYKQTTSRPSVSSAKEYSENTSISRKISKSSIEVDVDNAITINSQLNSTKTIRQPSPLPIELFTIEPQIFETVKTEFNYLDENLLADGRQFIRFKTQVLIGLNQKKAFQIPLTDHPNLTGVIDSIKNFEGLKHLSGEIMEMGRNTRSQFSLTVSEQDNYVVGNFSIGQRSFSLEVKNNVGWINDDNHDMARLLEFEKEFHAHPHQY